jgi:hypothetical protein
LFWGEKVAVGAIDIAKAPNNFPVVGQKAKKTPAAHKKCPVDLVDQKSLKFPPKNRLRRPLFWPKMGCIRPFFGLRPGMPQFKSYS